MTYIITELKCGLCSIKIRKSYSFWCCFPFIKHSWHTISPTYIFGPTSSSNPLSKFCLHRKEKNCHNDMLKYLGNSLKYLGPIKVSHYAKFEALHVRPLPTAYFWSSLSLPRDYLLQKTGDVVSAAGRPGERVGVCSNVSCHKFCCFMVFCPARISNSIMVHTKTVLTRKKHKNIKERNKKQVKPKYL